MEADNALTMEYLARYPQEAARILEQISSRYVAALFSELPPAALAQVTSHLQPEMAAACLTAMDPRAAAALMEELPVESAARVFRHLADDVRSQLLARLPEKFRGRVQQHLRYAPDTAGALMNPRVDVLHAGLTVAEALRRVHRYGRAVGCEIYLIDDAHRVEGMVDFGRLLTSPPHARVRDIMNRDIQPVSSHTTLGSLLGNPGWIGHRRLPVVDRDGTLVGELEYARLHAEVSGMQAAEAGAPLENLLSLAGLYWVGVIQLLDSTLAIGRDTMGDRGEG